MSNIYTFSDELITIKKQETLDAQSLRKKIHFADLNLVDDKTVEYKGARLTITQEAFKHLLRLIGMNKTFAGKFETLFSAETKTAFINRIKDAMASNAGGLSEITLIVNPATKAIIGLSKEATSAISNERFLGVVDRILDQNSLEVTNWSINPTTGLVNINTFNPKAEFSVQGIKNEAFTGGVTFQNSPNGGFQVLPYVNRMWCTNGMTTSLAEEAYTLNSLDSTTMEKFFEQLNDLRRRNFAPAEFGNMVRNASATPASIYEMDRAYKQIQGIAGSQADNWIPLQDNLKAYATRGYENMDADQMRKAKSNQSVWSVVNGLTHFGTHGRSIMDADKMSDSDSTRLMMKAGELFGSKYNHYSAVPDIFGANVLTDHFQVGAELN
jgi:hypothetical protein